MINIVIPLAGKDKRFEERHVFKAFVPIEGKPLIKFCTDTLPYPFAREDIKIHFLVLKEHEEQYGVEQQLHALYPSSNVIFVDTMTEGAACTVLLAKEFINNEDALIIYLADIYFKTDLEQFIADNPDVDGFIPTFTHDSQKYSYAVVENDYVTKVAEKEVISNNASAGFYYFRKGSIFVECAEEMIQDDTKRAGLGEKKWFFICPVYNELLAKGHTVKIIPSQFEFDLGDDSFIEKYLS